MRSNLTEESLKSLESYSTKALWKLITEAQIIIRKREYEGESKPNCSSEYSLCNSDAEFEIRGDDSMDDVVILETGIIDLTSSEQNNNGGQVDSLKCREPDKMDTKLSNLKRKLLEISKGEDPSWRANKQAAPVSQSSQHQELEEKMNQNENSDTQGKDSQSINDMLSTEFYERNGSEIVDADKKVSSYSKNRDGDKDGTDGYYKLLASSHFSPLRSQHIPPFCNFNKHDKNFSKDVSYSPNIKVVDELLASGESNSLKTDLQKENARNKNLNIYVNHYDEHYIRQMISVKDLPRELKICLNYNPIRLKPWRIQDFKLNKESEYNSKRQLKKKKQYWEQENIVHDEFTDSYFANFYKYFDNLKSVDNPLQLNDRIAYPNSQELKEDKHFLRIYEFNRCKNMLLLALNSALSNEQRGYLFRNENLNMLVSLGLFNVDYDLLLISSRKEIEEYAERSVQSG